MGRQFSIAWRLIAGCSAAVALCLTCGVARGQASDIDQLRQQVAELQFRAERLDASQAEIGQLRAQVAALTAQLQQVELRPPPAPQPGIPASNQTAPSMSAGPLGLDFGPMLLPPQAAAVPQQPGMFIQQPPVFDVQPVMLAQLSVPGETQPSSQCPSNYAALSLPAAESDHSGSGGYGGYGGGYGDGLQIGFWGWLSYISSPQERFDTFWAWESQLDVTKSFTDRIAASGDFDFVDTNNGAYVTVEQLFVSILYPDCHDAILTVGKFDPPFGIERRDFWNRQTTAMSLLFFAQPESLVGMMWTQPFPELNLTFRPFVVNGWDDNLDNNQQPSLGMMVEYQPCKCLSLATTNWWGPEFADDNEHKLFFTEEQAIWNPTSRLTVSSEFLYGTTESPSGPLNWTGYAFIVSQSLCERWRVFVQWSQLSDPNGYISGTAEHAREIDGGFSYYLDKHVEARFGYQHNWSRPLAALAGLDQTDEISANLTFGY